MNTANRVGPSRPAAVAGLDTPVGVVSVLAGPGGVSEVSWREPEELAGRAGVPVASGERGPCAPVLRELREYFAGQRRTFSVPLGWERLTPSTLRVLRTLYESVGYGETVTYGELARRSDTEVGARGVGSIMGANPMPVIVPCHRVLAHDGLGGYSGGRGSEGLAVKRWLLTMEGALPPTLDWDPRRMTV